MDALSPRPRGGMAASCSSIEGYTVTLTDTFTVPCILLTDQAEESFSRFIHRSPGDDRVGDVAWLRMREDWDGRSRTGDHLAKVNTDNGEITGTGPIGQLYPLGILTGLKVFQATDPCQWCPLSLIRGMLGNPGIKCIEPDHKAVRGNGSR